MAFVSSFHGTTTIGHETVFTSKTSRRPTMQFGLDKMLKKYDDMARQTPKATSSSGPSGIWKTYSKSILEKFVPTRTEMFSEATTYEGMMDSITLRSRPFRAPGGSPLVTAADKYMAECVNRQYKALSCANGTYGVSCTEGTTRGAAEDSRTLALGAEFRMKHRSSNAKYADYFSNRKNAICSTHECSYEEALVGRYPQVASSMITGISEANGACIRYASPTDPAEKYMTECVDKQNKFRAVPMGIYGVMCQDGAVKGMSEFKRVSGLAARFRAGQIGKIAAEDRKFAVKKWARDNFTHMCSYEEELFNKYPSVAMAMRFESVRY